ncbi:MAG: TnsA endonuclease N-terminal domain-containing protein [Candidatus Dojkabacteria bacterium]|nr:TnsA endonuclease N-terminal domain-containing protein [Candidatus Dojkabacteria bacterium]
MKTFKGKYVIINKKKYIGKNEPIYRSSWEYNFMRYLDMHPNVINWASESIKIPYRSPLTGKYTIYIPDFFVSVIDKNGKKRNYLIEIKPLSQSVITEAKSKNDKMQNLINQAKWKAAEVWCKIYNIEFKIITEKQIFSF